MLKGRYRCEVFNHVTNHWLEYSTFDSIDEAIEKWKETRERLDLPLRVLDTQPGGVVTPKPIIIRSMVANTRFA